MPRVLCALTCTVVCEMRFCHDAICFVYEEGCNEDVPAIFLHPEDVVVVMGVRQGVRLSLGASCF